MASQFAKSKAEIDRLIEKLEEIYNDLGELAKWSDEEFEDYKATDLSLGELEKQANRYRKNLGVQRRDPSMSLYGPKMVKNLDKFLENEETLSTLWGDRIVPKVLESYNKWEIIKKNKEEMLRNAEADGVRELINQGREQTQVEEQERLHLLNAKELELKKELEIEAEQTKLIREWSHDREVYGNNVLEWFSNEREYSFDEAMERALVYILQAEPLTEMKSKGVNSSWIYIYDIIDRIYRGEGTDDDRFKLKILREDNNMFQSNFSGYLDGVRTTLIAFGYRPLIGRQGAEFLLELLDREVDDDPQLRRSLISLIKEQEKLLPELEGMVWWYLPEPTEGHKGFDEYKLWLADLSKKLIKLKDLIDIVGSYEKGAITKAQLEVTILSDNHKVKHLDPKPPTPSLNLPVFK